MDTTTVQSLNTIATGAWTHVVVRVDNYSNKVSFVINGEVDSEYSITNTVDTHFDGTDLMIGTDLFNNDHYIGNISDLTVFHGAITDNKINALSYEPVLTLGYRFNRYKTTANYTDFSDISNTNATLVGSDHMDLVNSYKNDKKGVRMTSTNYLTTDLSGKLNVNFDNTSVTAWIYLDSESHSTNRFVFHKNNSFSIQINTSNKVVFDGENNTPIVSTDSLLANTWYHLAVTINGTEVLMYLDGVLMNASETALSTPLTNTTEGTLFIGYNNDTTIPIHFGEGIIDDILVFNTALRDVSVNNLFSILKSSATYQNSIDLQLNKGTWYHIAATYDYSTKTLKTFNNGQLLETYNNYEVPETTNDELIFIGKGTSAYFYGQLDDVRIYGNTLNEDDIYQLYSRYFSSTDKYDENTVLTTGEITATLSNVFHRGHEMVFSGTINNATQMYALVYAGDPLTYREVVDFIINNSSYSSALVNKTITNAHTFTNEVITKAVCLTANEPGLVFEIKPIAAVNNVTLYLLGRSVVEGKTLESITSSNAYVSGISVFPHISIRLQVTSSVLRTSITLFSSYTNISHYCIAAYTTDVANEPTADEVLGLIRTPAEHNITVTVVNGKYVFTPAVVEFVKGDTYIFDNSANASSHPFNLHVSNDTTGDFTFTQDESGALTISNFSNYSALFAHCTLHTNMGSNVNGDNGISVVDKDYVKKVYVNTQRNLVKAVSDINVSHLYNGTSFESIDVVKFKKLYVVAVDFDNNKAIQSKELDIVVNQSTGSVTTVIEQDDGTKTKTETVTTDEVETVTETQLDESGQQVLVSTTEVDTATGEVTTTVEQVIEGVTIETIETSDGTVTETVTETDNTQIQTVTTSSGDTIKTQVDSSGDVIGSTETATIVDETVGTTTVTTTEKDSTGTATTITAIETDTTSGQVTTTVQDTVNNTTTQTTEAVDGTVTEIVTNSDNTQTETITDTSGTVTQTSKDSSGNIVSTTETTAPVETDLGVTEVTTIEKDTSGTELKVTEVTTDVISDTTTTVVTDNTTNTVTETVISGDDSKVETVTSSDGSVTQINTDSSGNVLNSSETTAPTNTSSSINVESTVTFNSVSFSSLDDPDFNSEFRTSFKSDISTSAGVPVSSITITSVTSGSVVVNSIVSFGADGASAATAFVNSMNSTPTSVFVKTQTTYGNFVVSSVTQRVDDISSQTTVQKDANGYEVQLTEVSTDTGSGTVTTTVTDNTTGIITQSSENTDGTSSETIIQANASSETKVYAEDGLAVISTTTVSAPDATGSVTTVEQNNDNSEVVTVTDVNNQVTSKVETTAPVEDTVEGTTTVTTTETGNFDAQNPDGEVLKTTTVVVDTDANTETTAVVNNDQSSSTTVKDTNGNILSLTTVSAPDTNNSNAVTETIIDQINNTTQITTTLDSGDVTEITIADGVTTETSTPATGDGRTQTITQTDKSSVETVYISDGAGGETIQTITTSSAPDPTTGYVTVIVENKVTETSTTTVLDQYGNAVGRVEVSEPVIIDGNSVVTTVQYDDSNQIMYEKVVTSTTEGVFVSWIEEEPPLVVNNITTLVITHKDEDGNPLYRITEVADANTDVKEITRQNIADTSVFDYFVILRNNTTDAFTSWVEYTVPEIVGAVTTTETRYKLESGLNIYTSKIATDTANSTITTTLQNYTDTSEYHILVTVTELEGGAVISVSETFEATVIGNVSTALTNNKDNTDTIVSTVTVVTDTDASTITTTIQNITDTSAYEYRTTVTDLSDVFISLAITSAPSIVGDKTTVTILNKNESEDTTLYTTTIVTDSTEETKTTTIQNITDTSEFEYKITVTDLSDTFISSYELSTPSVSDSVTTYVRTDKDANGNVLNVSTEVVDNVNATKTTTYTLVEPVTNLPVGALYGTRTIDITTDTTVTPNSARYAQTMKDLNLLILSYSVMDDSSTERNAIFVYGLDGTYLSHHIIASESYYSGAQIYKISGRVFALRRSSYGFGFYKLSSNYKTITFLYNVDLTSSVNGESTGSVAYFNFTELPDDNYFGLYYKQTGTENTFYKYFVMEFTDTQLNTTGFFNGGTMPGVLHNHTSAFGRYGVVAVSNTPRNGWGVNWHIDCTPFDIDTKTFGATVRHQISWGSAYYTMGPHSITMVDDNLYCIRVGGVEWNSGFQEYSILFIDALTNTKIATYNVPKHSNVFNANALVMATPRGNAIFRYNTTYITVNIDTDNNNSVTVSNMSGVNYTYPQPNLVAFITDTSDDAQLVTITKNSSVSDHILTIDYKDKSDFSPTTLTPNTSTEVTTTSSSYSTKTIVTTLSDEFVSWTEESIPLVEGSVTTVITSHKTESGDVIYTETTVTDTSDSTITVTLQNYVDTSLYEYKITVTDLSSNFIRLTEVSAESVAGQVTTVTNSHKNESGVVIYTTTIETDSSASTETTTIQNITDTSTFEYQTTVTDLSGAFVSKSTTLAPTVQENESVVVTTFTDVNENILYISTEVTNTVTNVQTTTVQNVSNEAFSYDYKVTVLEEKTAFEQQFGIGWNEIKSIDGFSTQWFSGDDDLLGYKGSEFLFTTGDYSRWLIADHEQVNGTVYGVAQRTIKRSSISETPYTAEWIYDNSAYGNQTPMIYIGDGTSTPGRTNATLMYAEHNQSGYSEGLHTSGMFVYTRTPPNVPRTDNYAFRSLVEVAEPIVVGDTTTVVSTYKDFNDNILYTSTLETDTTLSTKITTIFNVDDKSEYEYKIVVTDLDDRFISWTETSEEIVTGDGITEITTTTKFESGDVITTYVTTTNSNDSSETNLTTYPDAESAPTLFDNVLSYNRDFVNNVDEFSTTYTYDGRKYGYEWVLINRAIGDEISNVEPTNVGDTPDVFDTNYSRLADMVNNTDVWTYDDLKSAVPGKYKFRMIPYFNATDTRVDHPANAVTFNDWTEEYDPMTTINSLKVGAYSTANKIELYVMKKKLEDRFLNEYHEAYGTETVTYDQTLRINEDNTYTTVYTGLVPQDPLSSDSVKKVNNEDTYENYALKDSKIQIIDSQNTATHHLDTFRLFVEGPTDGNFQNVVVSEGTLRDAMPITNGHWFSSIKYRFNEAYPPDNTTLMRVIYNSPLPGSTSTESDASLIYLSTTNQIQLWVKTTSANSADMTTNSIYVDNARDYLKTDGSLNTFVISYLWPQDTGATSGAEYRISINGNYISPLKNFLTYDTSSDKTSANYRYVSAIQYSQTTGTYTAHDLRIGQSYPNTEITTEDAGQWYYYMLHDDFNKRLSASANDVFNSMYDRYLQTTVEAKFGKGWRLIKSLRGNSTNWFTGDDNLQGYTGLMDPTPLIGTQFLFTRGDHSHWLIADQNAIDGVYTNENRLIKRSSISSIPYQAQWYNRGDTNPEDPVISLEGHTTSITNKTVMYAENKLSYVSGDPIMESVHSSGMFVYTRNIIDVEHPLSLTTHGTTNYDSVTDTHTFTSDLANYLYQTGINNPAGGWPHTVSFWIYVDSTTWLDQYEGTAYVIRSGSYVSQELTGDDEISQNALTLKRYDNALRWTVSFGTTRAYESVDSGDSTNYTDNGFSVDAWIHIAVVCDGYGNAVKVYQNGVEKTGHYPTATNSSTALWNLKENSHLMVGKDPKDILPFIGKISHFKVFDEVLDQEHISNIFVSGIIV